MNQQQQAQEYSPVSNTGVLVLQQLTGRIRELEERVAGHLAKMGFGQWEMED